MQYHNITKDDMLNGDGLRVVLWVAGCTHGCKAVSYTHLANNIYTNWLNYYVYQTTPYDLEGTPF